MTDVFVDTSVIVTWFHSAGEPDVEAGRAVLAAHEQGVVHAQVLDLAIYELGNVLARSLRWPPERITDQIEDLLVIVGAPVSLDARARADAAALTSRHRLTFYDASWAAVARRHGAALISSDRELLTAGLALTASAFVSGSGQGDSAWP